MIFQFNEAPPLGTLVHLDEQAYELAAVEPYTRKDGSASALLRWGTACPKCEAGFSVTTGLSAKNLTRRCEVHRVSHSVVKGRRNRRVKISIILP